MTPSVAPPFLRSGPQVDARRDFLLLDAARQGRRGRRRQALDRGHCLRRRRGPAGREGRAEGARRRLLRPARLLQLGPPGCRRREGRHRCRAARHWQDRRAHGRAAHAPGPLRQRLPLSRQSARRCGVGARVQPRGVRRAAQARVLHPGQDPAQGGQPDRQGVDPGRRDHALPGQPAHLPRRRQESGHHRRGARQGALDRSREGRGHSGSTWRGRRAAPRVPRRRRDARVQVMRRRRGRGGGRRARKDARGRVRRGPREGASRARGLGRALGGASLRPARPSSRRPPTPSTSASTRSSSTSAPCARCPTRPPSSTPRTGT